MDKQTVEKITNECPENQLESLLRLNDLLAKRRIELGEGGNKNSRDRRENDPQVEVAQIRQNLEGLDPHRLLTEILKIKHDVAFCFLQR